MGRVVVGIDGGGTKTIAVTLDAKSGQLLGRSIAGSSNRNSVGPERARAALLEAIAKSLETDNIAAVCCCAAGVDREVDEERMRSWLAEASPASANILAFNDAVGPLASGTGGELAGVVVISGTGSVALGMDGKGRTERCSGWGPAFSDSGSAHDIGGRALAAVARAVDGRGPQTRIQPLLLQHLSLNSTDGLLDWAYSSEAGAGDWARVAALAPVVTAAAEEGDAVALDIIDSAANGLIHAAAVVATKLGFCPIAGDGALSPAAAGQLFTLVVAGGVFEANEGVGRVARAFREKAAVRLPQATVVAATMEMAAVGAAQIALKSLL